MSDESNSPSPEANPPKRDIKIGSQRPGYVPDTPKRKLPTTPVVPAPVHKQKGGLRLTTPPAVQQAKDAAEGKAKPAPQPAADAGDDQAEASTGPKPIQPYTPPAAEQPAAPEQPAAATTAAPATPEAPAAAETAGAEAAAPSTEAAPAASADEAAVAAMDAELQTKPAAASSDAAADAEVEAAVAAVDLADFNLNATDEELELEIAAAMGENVDNLLANQVQVKPEDAEIELDERYQATVLQTVRDSVLLELPGQRNGAIPMRQFEEGAPEPGTVMEVIPVAFSPAEQLYELSIPGASVAVADWSDLNEGAVVSAKITGHNKGGLECEVNHIRGFIPAGQVSLYRVEDFSTFVDQQMNCVVIEANEQRRNLVLSHRAILEREREEKRAQLLAELEVGQTREGTVTRLQKFGAFVDLGGIDGLIHISQLSWDNIRDPSEVVKEGQKVKVRVERVDEQTGKIGLSYRDLMHHPWEGIDGKYPEGSIVKGTVSKLMDFGAFVKLEPGVEGLVHISELSHKRVNRVSHVVEEGQRIDVKVLTVDAESQRISLSIKATLGEPVEEASETTEADEPVERHEAKIPLKSLKGGVSKPSGGEQFGLKW